MGFGSWWTGRVDLDRGLKVMTPFVVATLGKETEGARGNAEGETETLVIASAQPSVPLR